MTAQAGRQAWRRKAVCVGVASEVFFPPADDSGQARPWSAEPARALCGTCPVREECLRWAVATRQPDGVWGGADPTELRGMWRRARSPRAQAS